MRPVVFAIVLASLAACSQKNESPALPKTPAASPVVASGLAEFKKQPLEPAEEKRIIAATQSQKADDGANKLASASMNG